MSVAWSNRHGTLCGVGGGIGTIWGDVFIFKIKEIFNTRSRNDCLVV